MLKYQIRGLLTKHCDNVASQEIETGGMDLQAVNIYYI